MESLDDAKSSCSNDPLCDGVYDDDCNVDGNHFRMCKKGSIVDYPYDPWCIYRKTSKHLKYFSQSLMYY